MRCVVIGAGPSGMMCSGLLAKMGCDVNLLEKNEKLGKKLYISGKGRCNVTNNADRQTLLNNVVSNPKFLMSSLSRFTPQETMNFFEELNVPLKIERGNRVFPVSDKSSDIIKAFENFLKNNNVNISLNTEVLDIKKQNEEFIVKTNKKDYICDKLFIATGGVSYPLTGSSGDGYKWAIKFKHNIQEIKPALCALYADSDKSLAGLSLKNVEASVYIDDSKIESEFGEMLFTHFGVSGPIILTLSSKINRYYEKGRFIKPLKLKIDLKPAISNEELDARLVRDFSSKSNMIIKNILQEYMPKSLISTILKQAKIYESTKANSIDKNMRKALLNAIKSLTFNIKDMDKIDNAIVTSGGVDVKDINPKTMESKICKNLYFIGEVLDIDALTGGFNIQLALSTAFVAAQSVIE